MRFHFASWLTKDNVFNKNTNKGIPVPMRIMFGKIVRETEKSYVVEVYGKPEPSMRCLHCGRKLTHKVSQYYGLGPKCGQHFYISGITEENLKQHFDDIRKKMAQVRWRGLIPKSAVAIDYEEFHEITFSFNNKLYKVTTSDITKVNEIYEKGVVISDDVKKG